MTEISIFVWKLIRNVLLTVGLGVAIIGIILLRYGTSFFSIEEIRWILPIGLATTSLSIAFHSIVISKESDKKMTDLEEKNYVNKLIRFKEENQSNLNLINKLIGGKDHYLPQHILDSKMKIKKEDKNKKLKPGEIPRYLQYTPEEQGEIIEGRMWIPKDELSYDYALQVIDISHYATKEEFIEKIREYVDAGKQLNVQKNFCQTWILTRPYQPPNPDEAKNYYTRLDNAKEICEKMAKVIDSELKEQNIKM